MIFLTWFYKQLGLIGCILISIIILLLIYACYLHFSLNSLQNKYIDTTNELIKSDSLKRVLIYNNKTLSERYASQLKNLDNEVNKNAILKKYVKDNNLTVLSLINKVEELKIENQILKGKVILDSLGNKTAEFDTTNKEYSLQAVAQVEPIPYLKIGSLIIIDSSSVGISKIDKNGLLKGFIIHSNKYVKDINADFSYQLTDKDNWIIPSFKVSWKWIPISIGVGALGALLLTK